MIGQLAKQERLLFLCERIGELPSLMRLLHPRMRSKVVGRTLRDSFVGGGFSVVHGPSWLRKYLVIKYIFYHLNY